MTRTITEKEAMDFIGQILKDAGEPLSMDEIRTRAKAIQDVTCRDGLPRTLSKMRFKGLVKGEMDPDRKEWLWWVE